MLKSLWRKLRPTAEAVDGRQLTLESENQRLRLELQEARQSLAQTQTLLERERQQAFRLAEETSRERLLALLSGISAPIVQFITQIHLSETPHSSLKAVDVLAVARGLLRALQNQGLALEGQVGEHTTFDPDRHSPINVMDHPAPGDAVVVRFVGLAYQKRQLCKAGVSLENLNEPPAV